MDSRVSTYQHIHVVQKYLGRIIGHLLKRQREHDQSKLISPEVEYLDQYTHKLKDTKYGSAEYNQCLEDMQPALKHHYSVNSHHPQFYENGVKGMSLIDLCEMLADWKAATERTPDGSIYESISINQKRFGYSDELKQIFLNTLKFIEDGQKGVDQED
jgi:hypothetical protein